MWHQVESVVAGTLESLGQINRRSVSTTQRASSTKPEASAHGVPFRPCIASLLQVKASWSLAVIAAGPENAAREDCSYMNVRLAKMRQFRPADPALSSRQAGWIYVERFTLGRDLSHKLSTS